MNFTVLSDGEVKTLETTPFNPPTFDEKFTEQMFDDEWWSVHAALKIYLSQRAQPYVNTRSWGDFSLSQSRGDSRWIYISFHTPRLWKADFCEFVSAFLWSLEHEYSVGCLTEMESYRNLFTKPNVYLAITRDNARGQCKRMKYPFLEIVPHNKYLRRFGFDV